MRYLILEMPDDVADENRTAVEILERAAAGGVTLDGKKYTWSENIARSASHFSEIQNGKFAPEVPAALQLIRKYIVPA